jgi:hypothetical protein
MHLQDFCIEVHTQLLSSIMQKYIAVLQSAICPGVQVVFWAYGGDFGDTPHDAQFCANGLVFPDRT